MLQIQYQRFVCSEADSRFVVAKVMEIGKKHKNF